MKALVTFALLILIKLSGFSQNILEALKLKEDSIREYVQGEAMATDTIIDLKNGYYEAFASYDDNQKTALRQASLFLNKDGTKTLGISIGEADFQCLFYQTSFYEISKSNDKIKMVTNENVLPRLAIKEFIADTSVYAIINKYLPEIKENYLSSDASVDKVLSEFYDIAIKKN